MRAKILEVFDQKLPKIIENCTFDSGMRAQNFFLKLESLWSAGIACKIILVDLKKKLLVFENFLKIRLLEKISNPPLYIHIQQDGFFASVFLSWNGRNVIKAKIRQTNINTVSFKVFYESCDSFFKEENGFIVERMQLYN